MTSPDKRLGSEFVHITFIGALLTKFEITVPEKPQPLICNLFPPVLVSVLPAIYYIHWC